VKKKKDRCELARKLKEWVKMEDVCECVLLQFFVVYIAVYKGGRPMFHFNIV
jgi:hypothetical protein